MRCRKKVNKESEYKGRKSGNIMGKECERKRREKKNKEQARRKI